MDLKIKKGYLIYKKGDEPFFVVPHSGPALEVTTSRDDNSETVASLCMLKKGGTLIVGNMPRKRLWGIDFNRDIPSKKIALEARSYFVEQNSEKMHEYKKRYAFIAFNEQDYEDRLIIYQNFWAEVEKGKTIIFVHRAFPKIKSVPSVIDIVTFKGAGIKAGLIKSIVEDLNNKYYDFFKKIEKDYKQAIVFEARRTVTELMRIYGKFDLNIIATEFRENLEKDLVKIEQYAEKEIAQNLKDNFTPQNFLEAIENALKNIPEPKITIENVFDGSLAFGPKRKVFPLQDKTVISVEPNRFMNFWHPHTTSDIILDIVEKINH